jgi:hypothetical protein
MTAATWYFFGSCPAEPTVADLARRLVRVGSPVSVRRPIMADGRPVGHEPADLQRPLRGSALYLLSDHAQGAVSFTCQRPDGATLERYEAIRLDAKPPAGEITSVGSLAAFDRGPRPFYRALARSTMSIVAELLPRGVAIGEDATALAFDALVAEDVRVETEFRVRGMLQIALGHLPDVARLTAVHPILSKLCRLDGRALTFAASQARLTEDEWGDLHQSLLRCAAAARDGKVTVSCPSRWDAIIHAQL